MQANHLPADANYGAVLFDGSDHYVREVAGWVQTPLSRQRSNVWGRLFAHLSKLARGMKK